jgi:hypothetical protein
MKTYVDFFSADNLTELTRQINEEAEARELEIVNVSLSQNNEKWFYALVIFGKEN